MTLQPPPTPQPVPEGSAPVATPVAPPPMTAMPDPVPQPTFSTPAPPVEQVPVSFWQQPFVQNGLPFITSLVLHLSVLILAYLLLAGPIQQLTNTPREQIIVPESEIVSNVQQGGIPHPGLGGDPTRDAAQDQFPDVPRDTKGIAEKPGPSLQVSLMTGGGGGDESGAQIIGVGAGTLGKGRGTGAGSGSGYGSGDDAGGALAPFGVPGGGGGIGPKLSFIGMSGSAKRIAYVCDSSGSMLNMFDALRFELRKSIEGLKPIQAFNVIFFQDQGFAAVDKDRLMVANPDSKRRTYDFLDKFFVRGATNPIPALELAFKQQPELIFLLTDGDFSGPGSPGNEAVINYCKQKTADGKVKIKTLGFVNKETKGSPQDMEFIKVLQTIAKNSGGEFRMVTEEDMGGR